MKGKGASTEMKHLKYIFEPSWMQSIEKSVLFDAQKHQHFKHIFPRNLSSSINSPPKRSPNNYESINYYLFIIEYSQEYCANVIVNISLTTNDQRPTKLFVEIKNFGKSCILKINNNFNDFLIRLYYFILWNLEHRHRTQRLNIMCIQPDCWTVNFLLNVQSIVLDWATNWMTGFRCFFVVVFVAVLFSLVWLFYLLWQFFSWVWAQAIHERWKENAK